MVARDFVLFEEIFDDELSAFAVVESAVAFEKRAYFLGSEMGVGHLFLRQLLDSLHYGLIAHLQHDQLRGRHPLLKYLLRSLLGLLSFGERRQAHEDLFGVFVFARESIEDVAAVEAVVLGESPLVAFVEKLVTESHVDCIGIEGSQWFT